MPAPDPSAFAEFAAFERAGWTRVAPGYVERFGRCTSQAIEPLLDAARVTGGSQVLDLACGPGFAAAAALARGAKAAGLDFSPPMVENARAACPGSDIREGDAAALPWPAASFDAIVCNFGINHFPDVEAALREAHRVLKPGGRLAFTVWDAAERSSGQKLLNDAIAAHGRLDAAVPPAPSAHRFADPGEARRTLEASGFTGVETRSFEVPLTAPTAEAVFEVFQRSTVRLGSLIHHQSAEDLDRIRKAFAAALEPWRTATGIAVPLRVVLTGASRP